MTPISTRRQFISAIGGALFIPGRASSFSDPKPMRGVFIIMSTPYDANKQVDYEDLANEVGFMDRSGVAGMVWPQMASEYSRLTKAERMRGMEVLAKAAKGTKPALVLGVQGEDLETALEYARHAESLAPDAMIAMPPTKAKSLDDFRRYYEALAGVTSRPFFIQTTGGARGIEPTVEFIAELARKFPNFGYVKEELTPFVERMLELAKHRPAIKSLFSGHAGRGMMYERRLGLDGTMPGAPLADIYAQIWNFCESGELTKARDLFSKLMLMLNVEQQIRVTRPYIMKKRGVFKTMVSRRIDVKPSPEEIAEIEFNFEALKPFLKA